MSTLQNSRLKNRLSPIYMLPDDVLTVIFEETFKNTFNFYRWTPFEIVVSHVTQRWRDVAINLSSLWCNIDITPFQSIDLLQMYLVRSQKRPLAIDFKLGASMDATMKEDESLAPSLVMLIAHVDRWRTFTVRHSYSTIKEIVTAIHPLSAPNLVHFGIYLYENDSQQDLSSYENAFSECIFIGGAPCLSYFECVGVGIQSCWPPLGALTELRLNSQEAPSSTDPPALPLSGKQFQSLLMSVPSLTALELKGPVVELRAKLSPIAFPYLISLDIDSTMIHTSYVPFQPLQLPPSLLVQYQTMTKSTSLLQSKDQHKNIRF